VQLHGEENIDYIKELKEKAPQLKIIKAINVKNPSDLDIVSTYKKICDLIILDSNTPGSGKSFDWGVIPNDFDKSRVLLSGGIGLDNVKDALQMGFEGLDLNSKLEITKGVKDVDTVNKVFSIINKF
jgi:phosphoribosylanthranilate isomerase